MSHEDQAEYRSWIRSGLTKVAPLAVTRALVESGDRVNPELWNDLVTLEVLGLAVPESCGGGGIPAVGLGIFLEEAGRCLLPAPYLGGTVLVPFAVRWADREDEHALLLAEIADGTARVGFAVAEASRENSLVANANPNGWNITGALSTVIDADTAHKILVVAETGDDQGLFLVDVGPGVDVEQLRSLDQSRPVARVTFADSSCVAVGDPAESSELVARIRDLLRLALAADAVGGSRRLLESTVEYAKTRVQFGRPIGEFQAIKHRCADLFVAVEAAAAAVEAGFAALDEAGFPRQASTSVASIYAQEAYWQATRTAMQVHGGLALTWEHETHLYLKRATSSSHMLGNPDRELRRLADVVLEDGYDVVAELIG